MRQRFVVDTNIVIRILTDDDSELVQQAERLIDHVEQGEISFYVLSMVVAEVCWVLKANYNYSKQEVFRGLHEFLQADGVEVEEPWIFKVLEDFTTHNVDFIDAYIARKAQNNSMNVITWNKKHFKRLDCEFYTPKNLI